MNRDAIRPLATISLGAAILVASATATAAPPVSFEDANSEPRPIRLGSSGGNINDISDRACCSGTLGALVADEYGAYVLSNNHVLARNNQGIIGEAILQPGLIDQGPACTQDTADAVAHLTAWAPISFDSDAPQLENTVDAAIAGLRLGEVNTSGEIVDVGIPSPTLATPSIGMSVQKRGRTTGHTFGTVAALNVTADVTYPEACGARKGHKARFVGQIRIDDSNGDFSAGGDSGSLVVTNDAGLNPVGLLFAGGRTGALLNPLDEVLGCLGVVMLGDDDAPLGTCAHGSNQVSGGDGDAGGDTEGPPTGRGRPNRGAHVPPGLEIAAEVQARHEASLFAIEGVVGTGLSVDAAGLPVIEVYLEGAVGDARRPVPAMLEGTPVRTVVTGTFIAE